MLDHGGAAVLGVTPAEEIRDPKVLDFPALKDEYSESDSCSAWTAACALRNLTSLGESAKADLVLL